MAGVISTIVETVVGTVPGAIHEAGEQLADTVLPGKK
jgi:hypothetical protein